MNKYIKFKSKYFKQLNNFTKTKDEEQQEKDRRKKKLQNYIILLLLIFHFGGSYLGVVILDSNSNFLEPFFRKINIDGNEFFRQMITTGLFLYFLFTGIYYLGYKSNKYKTALIISSLAFSISILLASEKAVSSTLSWHNNPETFSELVYVFITRHHAMMILMILMIFFVLIASYYLIRNVFVVQFSSTGIHLKLPGQSLYYLPIFPQISWQNTKITIKQGEKYWIELYGYVSPGAFQHTHLLKKHLDEVNKKIQKRKSRGEIDDYEGKLIWPYSSPSGYPKEYYSKEHMLAVLQEDALYNKEFYYVKDKELTVRGLTHNKVVGFIKGDDDHEDEPHSATKGGGYNWNNPTDKEKLICFSRDQYPFIFEAKKSGELYVVINDVDRARWDNGGMFFLKITKSSF